MEHWTVYDLNVGAKRLTPASRLIEACFKNISNLFSKK